MASVSSKLTQTKVRNVGRIGVPRLTGRLTTSRRWFCLPCTLVEVILTPATTQPKRMASRGVRRQPKTEHDGLSSGMGKPSQPCLDGIIAMLLQLNTIGVGFNQSDFSAGFWIEYQEWVRQSEVLGLIAVAVRETES